MASKIFWNGGNLQWFDGKLLFCDPDATSRLCAEIQCTAADGDVSGYRVLIPCGPLDLVIAGVVANDPEQCENCTDLNNGGVAWEIPENVTCGSWGETFVDPLLGNCSLIDLIVSLDLGVCCDDVANEIVLYADFRATFGAGGVSIRKELERSPIVDGACYTFDWSDPSEVFSCATADVSCTAPTLTANSCTHTNCDFSSATFTLSAA